MRTRIISIILLFSVTALFLPGCVFISRDFQKTRNDILNEIGDFDIETDVQFQLGSGLLFLGRMVVSIADKSNMADDYLRNIRNVQVGVYKLSDVSRDRPLIIPLKIAWKLAKKGYEPIIKVKERDSAAWVLTKMRGTRLSSLYVISLERGELVLAEIQGRLGRLVEKAVQNHGLKKDDFKGI